LACEEPLLGVETLGILGLALEPAKRRPSANPTLRDAARLDGFQEALTATQRGSISAPGLSMSADAD